MTSRKQEPGRKPSCLCSKVGGTGVFPVVRAGQGASRAVVVPVTQRACLSGSEPQGEVVYCSGLSGDTDLVEWGVGGLF